MTRAVENKKRGNTTSTGSKGLQYEDYRIDECYAITINPGTQPEGNKDLLIWTRAWHDLFVQYNLTVGLKLYPEVSQLGRFHWHGIMTVVSVAKLPFFLAMLNKNTHFEIDTISTCDCASAATAEHRTASRLKLKHLAECAGEKWAKYIIKQKDNIYDLYKDTCWYPMNITTMSKHMLDRNKKLKRNQPLGLLQYNFSEDLDNSEEDISEEELSKSSGAKECGGKAPSAPNNAKRIG